MRTRPSIPRYWRARRAAGGCPGHFAPQEAVILGIPANGPGNLREFSTTGDTSLLAFPYPGKSRRRLEQGDLLRQRQVEL